MEYIIIGAGIVLVYEFIDTYDDATNMTAMMRTTTFPASITAQTLAEPQKRHLRVTKRVTETWG